MHHLTKWLKNIIPALVTFWALGVNAQILTLDDVQEMARKNYPAVRQKNLLKTAEAINISNLNRNYLPQVTINGQASYQSDVTGIDLDFGGLKLESPAKDQYKITADVNQLLYDGGNTRHMVALARLNANVEDQQVEVELYKVREKINDTYLGILYTDALISQVDLVTQDLETGLKRVDAQVQNGVAFRSSSNIIKAELLKTGQRLAELRASRRSLIETLRLFTNQQISENTIFQKPTAGQAIDTVIDRPEIKLYNDQIASLDQQKKLIASKSMPRTSLFLQGGYGRPALNVLENEFRTFYITGVRFNWPLSNFYTKKNEKQLVKINEDIIDSKRNTFLLNTNAELARRRNDIEKMIELVEADKQIIDLRKSVTNSAKAQLENGVITASDYLREVTAEDQSRQMLITHELQLLQARIDYETTRGIKQ
jgi:outer membrane protein TolC